MWKTVEGSTGRLIQLCLAMFSFYVVFGTATKAFTASSALQPPMSPVGFLLWTTVGGSGICLAVVFLGGWFRRESAQTFSLLGLRLPVEARYVILAGIFTAVIIPTTTLLYILLKSVMVAMVVMRASIIVSSRIIDEIQKRMGILKKTVYWEENVAVGFAIVAFSAQALGATKTDFDFLYNTPALIVLIAFVVAYALRIFIMNYYKNTRPKGTEQNNKWYFSVEQISASVTMLLVGIVLFFVPSHFAAIVDLHRSVVAPNPNWPWALIIGLVYGMVAFFGVFIFMFKGRTATFAGLAYSQTSLAAGTIATLAAYFLLHLPFPTVRDWLSLALIAVAFTFLGLAERKRVVELAQTHELEPVGGGPAAGAGAVAPQP